MPSRSQRGAMYNTPHIRNGGFGALQLEAVTNRPLSIARRHLAASQLRMQDIEPHELSSSEWLRFLAMEDRERDRWMTMFRRRRRNSDESTSSADMDRDAPYDKAEEARQEALDSLPTARRATAPMANTGSRSQGAGTTPAVVAWARMYNGDDSAADRGRERSYNARRPMHARHAAGEEEALPTYSSAVRARTPPPAYQPDGVPPDSLATSPPYSLASPRYA